MQDIPAEIVTLLAHDLKNPLSALVTNLHFLRVVLERVDDADAAEALAESISLCASLDRFISNVDLVARGDRAASGASSVPIRQVAGELVARHRAAAAAAGLSLELEAHVEADVLAVIGSEAFLRAGANLIANALEHAPPGSRVAVEVSVRGAEAVVTIADQAPPVPPELRESAVTMSGYAAGRALKSARFGRGITLVAAALGARVAGARLEIDGEAGESRLRLVAPLGE